MSIFTYCPTSLYRISYYCVARMPSVAMAVTKEDLMSKLELLNQSHLLQFWDDLTEIQRQQIYDQIQSFDIGSVLQVYKDYASPKSDDVSSVEPITVDHTGSSFDSTNEQLEKYWNTGLAAIANGQVAVIVLAGGQATRLGASQPKGTLSLSLLQAHDSLLAIQAAQINKLQKLAKEKYPEKPCLIQWYVMTSGATMEATKQHFTHSIFPYIPLNAENVHYFSQSEIPCFTMEGKLILAQKHQIQTSPDGNGGLYKALVPLMDGMEKSGVKFTHVYCVDNILCRVADPHFIGFCIQKETDCAAKVVTKTDPSEAVGVVCTVKNIPQVVEYSEISTELSQMKDKNDESKLALRAGNIANHFFTFDFLKYICGLPMPYHPAFKKIPFIDENGEKISPQKPNGLKMEQFVFDVFRHSKNFFIWEVLREDEFSPLKNPDSVGKDCPMTCRHDLWKLHRRWVEAAGGEIVPKVEISNDLTYAGEGLSKHVKGKTSETPLHLV